MSLINRDFHIKRVRFKVQTPAEPELDPPEPEPIVQFEVQRIPWTKPEVRFKVQ